MTGFPRSPRLLKGGIVLVDPASGAMLRAIALQYNPELVTRTLAPHSAGGEGDRLEALRLKGPPTETIKIDFEVDTTDGLEDPGANGDAVQLGLYPQLAALETILYPTSTALLSANAAAGAGQLEIAAAESALTLFVWSKQRVVPVRITDFSVTEDAFDPDLNPIRAKVSLGMRVLSVNDLGFQHSGGGLFLAYLQAKEKLAGRVPSAALSALGITGI